jgi:hypothetical protein
MASARAGAPGTHNAPMNDLPGMLALPSSICGSRCPMS